MRPRIEFAQQLKDILGSDNVYFQPPASFEMKYPCIVYERDRKPAWLANNKNYVWHNRYQVTVIGKDPDTTIPDKLLEYFPLCEFNRHYAVDNLNHDVLFIHY